MSANGGNGGVINISQWEGYDVWMAIYSWDWTAECFTLNVRWPGEMSLFVSEFGHYYFLMLYSLQNSCLFTITSVTIISYLDIGSTSVLLVIINVGMPYSKLSREGEISCPTCELRYATIRFSETNDDFYFKAYCEFNGSILEPPWQLSYLGDWRRCFGHRGPWRTGRISSSICKDNLTQQSSIISCKRCAHRYRE